MSRLVPVLLALCALGAPAQATVVRAFSLDDLASFATQVVRGRVLDIESRWDDRLIYTDVEVEVADCLKGPCEERVVSVRVLGGAVDDLVMDVDGVARFALGEEVLLFLEAHPTGVHVRTVGMAQGKFRLDGGRALREKVPVRGPRAAEARRLSALPTAVLLGRLRAMLGGR